MDGRGDGHGRFIIHESFKDLKTRRAEQEAYRRALEEQIIQRKKLQEGERERDREKYECRKLHQNAYSNEHIEPNSSMTRQNIPPPNSFRNPYHQPTHPPTQQCPSPQITQLPHPPSFHFEMEGRPPLQNINPIDSFNEPHPAAFPPIPEENDYSNGTIQRHPHPPMLEPTHNGQDSKSETPSMSLVPQDKQLSEKIPPSSPPPPIRSSRGAPPPTKYSDQAFSSGTSSESSSYEDVLKGRGAVPKQHVSQTSEQLAGVKVSRTQYRAELQLQIDERRKREDEQRRKEAEAEDRIQEKIRIDQEKMQREYEEELRKQQERELEDEKKRLASLGRHNEALRAKAEEKIKSRESRLAKTPPSQRQPSSGGTTLDNGLSCAAIPSQSVESIQSICDFFESNMPPGRASTSASMTRQSPHVNPDERVIPVIANRLKEEAERKKLEGDGEGLKGDSTTPMCDTPTERVLRGNFLTARVSSAFSEPHPAPDNESSVPGMAREKVIRSAPPLTTEDLSEANANTGREFLTSLKSYLQDEKVKLMERIQARGSKSNEKF